MNVSDQNNEQSKPAEENRTPEMVRREFLKRFGSYAVGSAVGLYVLMSPTSSKKAMCASDAGPK